MARIGDFKKYDRARNILIPDISVDSDLRIKVEHWRVSVDSDYVIMRDFESDFFKAVYAGGGILASLDSESRKAQKQQLWIDSESRRVSNHYYELQQLLDSEYAKNRDFIVTMNALLDSEYRQRKDEDSDIRASIGTDLDSEIHDRKAADSDLRAYTNMRFDSEYRKSADWYAYAQQKFDSDELALQDAKTHLENLLDSEYRKNRDWFAYAEQRLDSDEQKLQDNLTYLENRIDSEYRLVQTKLTNVLNERDSDVLKLRTDIDSEVHYLKAQDSDQNIVIRDNDSEINRRLDSETHDRKGADSDIIYFTNLALTLERHDRMASDSDLSIRVTFLENKREDSEQLDYKLDSEEQARKAKDSDLSDRISKELHDRAAGDSDILARMDSDRFWGGELTGDIYTRNTGNVGIGTTPGNYSLNVLSSDYFGARVATTGASVTLDIGTTTDNGSLQYYDSGERLNIVAPGRMQFTTGRGTQPERFSFMQQNGSYEAMRINNIGNVGIGTISPEDALHIYRDESSSSPVTATTFNDFIQLDQHIGDIKTTPTGPSIRFNVKDGNNTEAIARIKAMVVHDAVWGDNDEGAMNIVFETTNAGVSSDKFFVTGEGNVAVGNVPTAAGSPFFFDMTGASDPNGLNRPTFTGDGTGVIDGGTF